MAFVDMMMKMREERNPEARALCTFRTWITIGPLDEEEEVPIKDQSLFPERQEGRVDMQCLKR